jgi:hypothetical protein
LFISFQFYLHKFNPIKRYYMAKALSEITYFI